MIADSRQPLSGEIITFSAGTVRPDPAKWRALRPDHGAKLVEIIRYFPELREVVSTKPLVINAYPATFAAPASLPYVDSYGRWQAFASAMGLAASCTGSAALVGMPLTVAHLVLRTLENGGKLPKQLLLLLGGYYCPASLEAFLLDLLSAHGVMTAIIHLYGVAEIDAGLLAARRIEGNPSLLFRAIDHRWTPLLVGGNLAFRAEGGGALVVTDDPAVLLPGGVILSLPSARIAAETIDYLESWGHAEWLNRTGFLTRGAGGFEAQGRIGHVPTAGKGEIDYFDFCKVASHSWLDKPSWK